MKLITRLTIVLLIIVAAIITLANYKLTNRVVGKYVETGGAKIHYTVEGKGIPVVLIHGFGANIDWNWRNPGIIDDLKKDYKVIAIDVRGHGLSSKPHNMEEYGENIKSDIYAVLDNEGIEKAHLVGYSLGGLIGLNLAVESPEKWYSFTSIASGWERADTSIALKSLGFLAGAIRNGDPIHLIKYITTGEKYGNIVISSFLKLAVGYYNDPLALAAVIESMGTYAIDEEVLKANKLPIGIIIGTNDELLWQARGLASVLPNEQYIEIEGGNHFTTPSKEETKIALLNVLAQFDKKYSSY